LIFSAHILRYLISRHHVRSNHRLLLSDYLISLRKNLPNLSHDGFAQASHATKNVLPACLAPTQERFRQAETELNAVLVVRIKRYIDKNLLSPDLGPNTICREMAISRAKLYRLFEPSGGVAREIQRKRLLRARMRLLDPAAPRMRISEIAWEHGFVSESHFSRVFNKTFGCSPREMESLKEGRHITRASEDANTRPANLAEWMRSISVA
jgi:AraC-like DNA-binding protein